MEELPDEVLAEAVDRLRTGLEPMEILLYGSYAYGDPHEDSDVDLLIVVEDTGQPTYEQEAKAYRLLAGLKLPAEIRVVTRSQYRKRAQWIATIEREVEERGIRLYAAA